MDANNWDYCPRCKKNKNDAKDKAIKAAAEAYGKVSLEEYQKLVDAAKNEIRLETTMREDYYLGLAKDGTFEVDYRCSCEKCDFEFSFTHKQAVKIAAE